MSWVSYNLHASYCCIWVYGNGKVRAIVAASVESVLIGKSWVQCFEMGLPVYRRTSWSPPWAHEATAWSREENTTLFQPASSGYSPQWWGFFPLWTSSWMPVYQNLIDEFDVRKTCWDDPANGQIWEYLHKWWTIILICIITTYQ